MADVLMTQKTLDYLTGRKRELEERLIKQGQDSDGGHQRASVHDDQASELSKNEINAELGRIGKLNNTKIVFPRSDTTSVGLGNRVNLMFLQPDEELSALVLTSVDAMYAARTHMGDIITPESPLGKAILGRSVGDEIEIKTKPPKRVRIDSVLPGDF